MLLIHLITQTIWNHSTTRSSSRYPRGLISITPPQLVFQCPDRRLTSPSQIFSYISLITLILDPASIALPRRCFNLPLLHLESTLYTLAQVLIFSELLC